MFFDRREAQARSLGRFTHSAFCAVVRPPDHPLRPKDYVPLDAFWGRRGYDRADGMTAHFHLEGHRPAGRDGKAHAVLDESLVMPTIRIAAAQYPIEALESLDAYQAKFERWVADAVANRAQLLVFPEYGAMEYAAASGAATAGNLQASLAAVSGALRPMDAAHADLARRHRVHILAASGPSERAGRPVRQCRAAVQSVRQGGRAGKTDHDPVRA